MTKLKKVISAYPSLGAAKTSSPTCVQSSEKGAEGKSPRRTQRCSSALPSFLLHHHGVVLLGSRSRLEIGNAQLLCLWMEEW